MLLTMQAAAGRRLFSACRNAGAAPSAPQPAAASSGARSQPAQAQAAHAQPAQQQAHGWRPEIWGPEGPGAPFRPGSAWPPSAGAHCPPQQAQVSAAAAAARAYEEALRAQPAGAQPRQATGARHAGRHPPQQPRQNRPMHRQPWQNQPRPAQAQPWQNQPRPAPAQPTAFVDLDSSSDASSSDVHGPVQRPSPQCTTSQAAAQPEQDPQPGSDHGEDVVTSPLSKSLLGAHRRPPAATGSIFRPVPPVPKYLRRASTAQPPSASQAAPEGADAAEGAATGSGSATPDDDHAAAAPSHASADATEQSPSKCVSHALAACQDSTAYCQSAPGSPYVTSCVKCCEKNIW